MKLDDIQRLIDMRKHRGIEMSLFESLWWRFMPGVTITVRWPRGVESSDPNHYYRPWLEQHVGRQGWDWDWRLFGNNVAEDCLTIKVRRPHAKYATIASIRWA